LVLLSTIGTIELKGEDQAVKGKACPAFDVAIVENIELHLRFFQQVDIGVLGVMMCDDPIVDLAVIDEDSGIADGGVAPADLFLVLHGGILCFVDQKIASFEELDLTLIGIEQVMGLADRFWAAVITHEKFVVCGVSKEFFMAADLEAKSGSWMESVMGIDLNIADFERLSFLKVLKDDLGLNVV